MQQLNYSYTVGRSRPIAMKGVVNLSDEILIFGATKNTTYY